MPVSLDDLIRLSLKQAAEKTKMTDRQQAELLLRILKEHSKQNPV